MQNITVALFAVVGTLVIGIGFGLLFAFPVMWSWNYAVVAVWHLPAITWGQAWCLSFLASVLLKSSVSTSSK